MSACKRKKWSVRTEMEKGALKININIKSGERERKGEWVQWEPDMWWLGGESVGERVSLCVCHAGVDGQGD